MAYGQSFILSVTNLLLYAPLLAVMVDLYSTNLISNNLISYIPAIIIFFGVSIFTLLILHQTTQLCDKLDTEQISVIIRTRKITSLFLYHTVYITPFERSIGTTRNAIIPREKVKFAPGLTLIINLCTDVGMLILGMLYISGTCIIIEYNKWLVDIFPFHPLVNMFICVLLTFPLFFYNLISYHILKLQSFRTDENRNKNELTYAFHNFYCKHHLLIVLANWDVCFVTIESTCDDKTENITTEESKELDNIVVLGNVPTAQLCHEAQIVPTAPYPHNTNRNTNSVRNSSTNRSTNSVRNSSTNRSNNNDTNRSTNIVRNSDMNRSNNAHPNTIDCNTSTENNDIETGDITNSGVLIVCNKTITM
jgi:hypothetical protein